MCLASIVPDYWITFDRRVINWNMVAPEISFDLFPDQLVSIQDDILI
jgi:hypothetical protein